MNSYESMFIMHPETEEEVVNAFVERVTGAIEKAGTVVKVDAWGNKKLAYEINKVREGKYFVVTFDAEPSVLDELNHIYKITETVLRGIVIRLEK